MKTFLICMLLLLISNNTNRQYQSCNQVVSEKSQDNHQENSNKDSSSKFEPLQSDSESRNIEAFYELSCNKVCPSCFNSGFNGEDDISKIALTVNSVNNILTWSTIVLGVITLLVAIVGILGYRELKKECKQSIKKAEENVDNIRKEVIESLRRIEEGCKGSINASEMEMAKIKENVNQNLKKIQDVQKEIELQNQRQSEYTKVINRCIYSLSLALGAEKNSSALKNYHLINLFISETNSFDDINYLKENGTKEDIEVLQIIEEYDNNEKRKEEIRETIGYIKCNLKKP